VTIEDRPRLDADQGEVLAPLVRVIEEAAGDQPWALVGAAALRLQGYDAEGPNLEVVTTESAMHSLAEMLDVPSTWQRGAHVAAARLRFLRGPVPVFVHANPTFHGPYERLSPLEVPALWDARVAVEIDGARVLVTPLEWELLLAVVLGNTPRVEGLGQYLRERGYDGRLLTRLLRESRVESATEETAWAVLER
jgi:hypothetical protein